MMVLDFWNPLKKGKKPALLPMKYNKSTEVKLINLHRKVQPNEMP